jgi:hypothetical protein
MPAAIDASGHFCGGLMVGLAGFEPATFRPPDGRATRLRYSPNWGLFKGFVRRGKCEMSICIPRLFNFRTKTYPVCDSFALSTMTRSKIA